MAVKFTADQQRVIDLRNCNILVSAAAGSGKTAVLVERIVELVCDEKNGVDIDRLLVVTFTKAAASQMRERLTGALTRRLEEAPENDNIQRQLTLIHNAQITTIDSFCLQLIRNHFNDIGLDPDFRTADEGELKLLKKDVLQELLEEQFAAADPGFLHCVECFSQGGREDRLEELILTLYDFSMSYPWPKAWLEKHRADYALTDQRSLEQTRWYPLLQETVQMTLEACRQLVKEGLSICDTPDGPYMYAEALEKDGAFLEELLRCREAGGLQELLTKPSYAVLSRKKDTSVSAKKREQVKKLRDRMKGLLGELSAKYFYCSPAEWLSDMQKAAPAMEELLNLALLFQERLGAKKREKNLLDFNDMEHMALQILLEQREDGTIAPTRTALEYRSHFKEILIDEYQDSNLVQEFLLQSISGEDEGRFNRFMVGDVKQSIYKFRLARPELFMEKFEAYQTKDADCVRVDLKQNFRSRRQVTDCVNDIFLQIMHRGLGGVEYDSSAALYPAAVFPDEVNEGRAAESVSAHAESCKAAYASGRTDCYEPEFLLAVEEESANARQREAEMVSERILQLVGTLPVRDSESGRMRPARFGDVVILLRTASGWDETFKKVLTDRGIPVHVTSRTGYFAAVEVQTVLNYLRILNNPLQDIPLFGVLHSPIGGFSDREIAILRAQDESGKKKLYDCLEKMAAAGGREDPKKEIGELPGKAAAFLAQLEHFRTMAVYLPIHTLMERILEETGYLYQVSAMPGGSQRQINLEMLLARAENYEKTSYSGLFQFVRYIEQMEKYDIDFGETGTLDENADIVRIMSIHKSKGLEFPICFVSGLSKRFNRQDMTQPVILDMDLGVAADCIDPVLRTRRTTIKKNILARKLQTDSLGEELRVLYVALTRAEEKLILTACCKPDKAETIQQAAEEAARIGAEGIAGEAVLTEISKEAAAENLPALSPVRLLECGSYFDILWSVWQQAGRKITCIGAEALLAQEVAQQGKAYQKGKELLFLESAAYEDSRQALQLQQRFDQAYGHKELAELFVKTTVSELKKAGMEEEESGAAQLFADREREPYLPRFIRSGKTPISGTARGSAYHRVLELFPFGEKEQAADWQTAQIAKVMEKQCSTGALSREFADAVDIKKIRQFLQSPMAQRMCLAQKAGRLCREQPFVLGLPASLLKPGLPESETVLIQGIIDVYWEEPDGLVLADYKTDRVQTQDQLIARYQVQLDYYTQALERILGKRVKEKLIYSLALGKEIRL